MEERVEVQAIRFKVGWNTMLTIVALPAPLLSSYKSTPSSTENTLMTVPLTEAVAMSVPSALTARAPTSYSCALIFCSMDLSMT